MTSPQNHSDRILWHRESVVAARKQKMLRSEIPDEIRQILIEIFDDEMDAVTEIWEWEKEHGRIER